VPGSLTIVGLGPARPEHVTLEAHAVLRDASRSGARIYGLAHARDVAQAVQPGLEILSLDYLYALPGVSRPEAYADLADVLLRRAFEDHLEVVYLVAGSPLFINDAVLLLRQRAAERQLDVRLVHGLSFVDLVLDRVFWTGHQGLQVLSAWNVARDGMRLRPDSPALLCQLGEFSVGGDALDPSGSTRMLTALKEVLLRDLPAEHPVIVLSSSGPPDYRSLGDAIPLAALDRGPVPVYSNLWVPAVDGPDVERRLAPAPGTREPR
jgi:tetrapyrrole methylase family protein / MazG family protein